MKKYRIKMTLFIAFLTLIPCAFLSSCGSKDHEPVTLTMWHVYGEQAKSPMDDLVNEFNETVGKEKGIVINVTASSNSAEIGDALLDSQDNNSGSKTMPDLFFCHIGNAEDLGIDNLVDWNEYFTKDELDDFVPDFIQDGSVNNKLPVLPFSKSTHMLYINGSMFDRFSEATGVTYDQLKSWDGFFDAAEKFYKWSGGKPFCALDYLLREAELACLSANPDNQIHNSMGWYDRDNQAFNAELDRFLSSLVKGHIIVSDLYANTQMMTGETMAGISSTAAVLYYNDTVTYPDNTSEDMNLKVLPLPTKNPGKDVDTLAGTGLCAYKTTEEKAKAAAIFAKWITEGERNLKFVTEAGYMPVRKEAFEKISDFKFKNDSYKQLYEALAEMRKTYSFLPETYNYDKVMKFYDFIRRNQKNWEERYMQGEDTGKLVEECRRGLEN